MFRELKARGAKAWLLGCSSPKSEVRLGATLTQPYGPDDYVYHPNAPFDYFKFANPDPKFPDELAELVAELKPDIVHSHHFVRFGVEMFSAIRRGWPQAKIVLSLHEYLAICNHHGQMMKTVTYRLCEKESYSACAACFPQHGERDFFLRKRYLQMFFEDVDLFISPSRFLAERFMAWGLPEEKLAVLENMPPERSGSPFAAEWDRRAMSGAPQAEAPQTPPKPVAMPMFSGGTRFVAAETGAGSKKRPSAVRPLKIGFFGQMSPLKGITVLMDAARRLKAQKIDNLVIEIYGDYSSQPLEFQKVVTEALEEAGENVVFHGAYDNSQVNALMQRIDAMVIPSTWWENSPVVIQEAFTNGKPVICSNIGGMAEKIVHGVNGLQFEVSRPASLAEMLADLATKPGLLETLAAGVRPPPTAAEMLNRHLDLYDAVIA
ncbi:glycosyltransferase family 4 protein [Acetobacteraceae bacterium KSS8]|uniref:Glycosyltransferase family 4 protein n=1 Tax=Endosaccharibacter trunci TaxID=2812733 RepID=A0ABT1W8U5_9PROT|nr:glycosyltransferase family 4 protein [Acetobacteraceae bacterium KSS8]